MFVLVSGAWTIKIFGSGLLVLIAVPLYIFAAYRATSVAMVARISAWGSDTAAVFESRGSDRAERLHSSEVALRIRMAELNASWSGAMTVILAMFVLVFFGI